MCFVNTHRCLLIQCHHVTSTWPYVCVGGLERSDAALHRELHTAPQLTAFYRISSSLTLMTAASARPPGDKDTTVEVHILMHAQAQGAGPLRQNAHMVILAPGDLVV